MLPPREWSFSPSGQLLDANPNPKIVFYRRWQRQTGLLLRTSHAGTEQDAAAATLWWPAAIPISVASIRTFARMAPTEALSVQGTGLLQRAATVLRGHEPEAEFLLMFAAFPDKTLVQLPGGKRNLGETTVQAAEREVEEELGRGPELAQLRAALSRVGGGNGQHFTVRDRKTILYFVSMDERVVAEGASA